MSRNLSAAAVKAMFSTESADTLITLLKISKDPTINLSNDIYLADNYTTRISETSEEIAYGVVSNNINYYFIPMEIILPNDDNASAPRATITIHDVTRYLIPYLRALTGAPAISLSLVLTSSLNTVEVSFSGLKLTNISYNAETISAELTMPSLEVEPFPAYSFTPIYFPGLF